jgi:D-xylose transport system ATP-binding protein
VSAPADNSVDAPAVALTGITKRFGGVTAVDGVDLDVRSGEVTALVGHNGAGKSTLLEVLAGALQPDAGEIRFDGVPATLRSPRDAEHHGVATLHQHLALADNLDATANVFLGHERLRHGLLDEGAMEREARALLARLQPGFDAVRVPVRDLSGGQRQLVAIARALRLEAKILLMDEPTAALGPGERQRVADLVRRLTDESLGIVLVSHDLEGALALADRVAVMRSGRIVATRGSDELDAASLAALVVGGEG